MNKVTQTFKEFWMFFFFTQKSKKRKQNVAECREMEVLEGKVGRIIKLNSNETK